MKSALAEHGAIRHSIQLIEIYDLHTFIPRNPVEPKPLVPHDIPSLIVAIGLRYRIGFIIRTSLI